MDEEDLLNQVLTVTVEVLQALITIRPFEASMTQALAALGKSTEVDRISLLTVRSEPQTKAVQLVRRFQWTKENQYLDEPLDSSIAFPYDLELACLYPILHKGKPFLATLDRLPNSMLPASHQMVCSVVILPILVNAQLWGMICLEEQNVNRKWFPDIIQSLLTVATCFGEAIRRGKLEQNESEQRILAEALRETANALNQSLRLSDVLERILSYIGTVVPHDAANVMLIINGSARVTACHGYENRGGEERVMKQVRIIAEVPNLKRMVETGLPIVVPDIQASPEWVHFDTSSWIHSYVSAPICRNGKTIGFINLNSATPGFYNTGHAQRLLAFANQAAIAIENARLFENAQREIAVRKRTEDALNEAKNELETRVAQRTQELRQANELLELELERRQQAEAELEKERNLLTLRVEERTAELSAANAELAKSAQLKDAFLASMSHELRTPLNAILNISESLQELVYGELNEAQTRSVRMIEESGRHLLALINDILDLSKIGAGRFELNCDRVPVKAMCEASLKLVEEAARKKGLNITASFDPKVKTLWADQRRLKQVLVNLLSNAVKFTPASGTVGLTLIGDPAKHLARFIVSDSGIGIPKESLQYLFKPFVQLDQGLDRQYEGTGLGLALAYHIVELHGGGIVVTSEVGTGSQFIVTMNWMEEVPGSATMPFFGQVCSSALAEQQKDEFDPLAHIQLFMNELGIEVQKVWTIPGSTLQRGQVITEYGILILDPHFLNPGSDILQALHVLGDLQTWPTLLLCDQPLQQEQSKLPRNIAILPVPFDRKQLRTAIKQITPDGTASLVRQAIILKEKSTFVIKGQPLILLVDDNETMLRVFSEYLTAKGFRVKQACNGQEACKRARELIPNLIVMDIQMPGMNGLEAIRKIRADSKVQAIPILALTALAMPGDRALCLAAGANEYLSKPISLNDFTDAIEKYLQPL